MKIKRILATIASIALLLTGGLGQFATAVTAYAQGKADVEFSAITSVEPLYVDGGTLLLGQELLQLTPTTAQVNVTIGSHEQALDFANAELTYHLAPSLTITSEKASISGLDESAGAIGEVSADGSELTIRFGEAAVERVTVTFEVAVKAGIGVQTDVPLSTQAVLEYQIAEEIKQPVQFPVPTFSLQQPVVAEPEPTPEAQPNVPEQPEVVLPEPTTPEPTTPVEPDVGLQQTLVEVELKTTTDKQALTVGDEITVHVEATGGKVATLPKTLHPAEWLFVFDTSASMKKLWEAPESKQALIEFITSIQAIEGSQVSGMSFNGGGFEVANVDQQKRPSDVATLFSPSDSLATIEAKIKALVSGQHVSDTTYTNTSHDAATNLSAVWTSKQLADFIATPATNDMPKNVIFLSDFIATTTSGSNGVSDDAKGNETAQAAALKAYQETVLPQLEKVEHADAITLYPIQFGNAPEGRAMLHDLQNASETLQPWGANTQVQQANELVAALASTQVRTQLVQEPVTFTTAFDTQQFAYVADSVTLAGAAGQLVTKTDQDTQTISFENVVLASEKVVLTYRLKALKSGTFELGSASLKSGDITKNASAIKVTVAELEQPQPEQPTVTPVEPEGEGANRVEPDVQSEIQPLAIGGIDAVNKTVTPTTIKQGEATEVTLSVTPATISQENTYEAEGTGFFTYYKADGTVATGNTWVNTTQALIYKMTSVTNASFSFTFTGTQFSWYYGALTNGAARIEVENSKGNIIKEDITWNADAASPLKMYTKTLVNDTYTVKITNIPKNGTAYALYSDKVVIQTTNIVTEQQEASFSFVTGSRYCEGNLDVISGKCSGTFYYAYGPFSLQTTFTGGTFKIIGSTRGSAVVANLEITGPNYAKTIPVTLNGNGTLYTSEQLPLGEYTVKLVATSGAINEPVKIQYERDVMVTVTDYFDATKFEYVPDATLGTPTVAGNKLTWNNVALDQAKQIKYKLRAKADAPIGLTPTNPSGQNGTVASKNFPEAKVTIEKNGLPEGNLNIDKTASYVDGKLQITLEVKGNPELLPPKKADIVIVIDKSGSMSDKIAQVKTAAKNFSQNILAGTKDDQVRIAVASFNYKYYQSNFPASPIPEGQGSEVVTSFTSNLTTINNAINSLSAGGGTNTQDGIWRAQSVLNGARSDAKKYVVFFTDGLPTQSNTYGGQGNQNYDQFFKAAQKEYYTHFKGWNDPTSIRVGGIGTNDPNYTYDNPETLNLTQSPYSNPTHPTARFYSVGLFTNATLADKQRAVSFLQTIQNVIEPSQFGDKYYTQNLSDINSIFMDISNDIKADINNSIAKDVVLHDVVTKEFDIVADSWQLTDLTGTPITLTPEQVSVIENANGEDEITLKIGEIVAGTDGVGGIRVTFTIDQKDPYFSGDGIPTNVEADLTYKDPEDGLTYEQGFPIPNVNIAPKKGQIKVTKNVIDDNGVVQTDQTPFEIVIERVGNASDPAGIVPYQQTYTLKSTEFGVTGIKHLVGPNTVSKDGSVILSTDVANQANYLVAGEYRVKEINLPEFYDIQEIKINGSSLKQQTPWQHFLNMLRGVDDSKYQATFTLSKDNANIDITVVNKSTITNKLIKNKTATPVLDADGKPTGEYEIALNVKTAVKTEQYLSSDWLSNVSKSPNGQTTYPTKIDKDYSGALLEIKKSATILPSGKHETNTYEKGLGVHSNSEIIYDLTKDPYKGYTRFKSFVGLSYNVFEYGTDSDPYNNPDVRFEVWVKKGGTYTKAKDTGTMNYNSNQIAIDVDITGATELKLVVNCIVNDYYDHANWADAKLTRATTPTITNAKITDIVTNDFNIVLNGYAAGKTSIVLDSLGNEINVTNQTISGNTLTWSPLTIDTNGLTVKFKVKPKDAYHAADNVDTNVEATVEYDGNMEYFNKPSVDLGVRGRVSVKKDVLNSQMSTETFTIILQGGKLNETYTFNLKASETKLLEVILSDENSIIEKPGTTFTIGEYIVEEINLPEGYTCTAIQIGEQTYPLGVDAKFTIDKQIPDIQIVVENKLVPTVDKTATEVGDRTYEIELVVTGNELRAKAGADIVVVMDSSGSMGGNGGTDYHTPVRNSLKKFVSTMMDQNENNRISVVDFSGAQETSIPESGKMSGSLSDATLVNDFSNDATFVHSKIDQLRSKKNAVTNYDAAFRQVKSQLEKSALEKPLNKRYVIFFTDGLPTSSVQGTGTGSQTNPYWGRTFPNAIEGDYRIWNVFNYTYYKSPVNAAVATYQTMKGEMASDALKQTQFYNVIFENNTNATLVKNLFGTAEATEVYPNVKKRNGGRMNDGENYSLTNIAAIDPLYETIATDIIQKQVLVNDATVSDIVTDEFEILPGQYDAEGNPIAGGTQTTVVTNIVTGEIIPLEPGQPEIVDNKLTWKIGDIPPEGIKIKFRVRAKDPYFGGKDVPTNKEATLEYTDVDLSKETVIFPIPNVDVPFTLGSITIRKEIVDEAGALIADAQVNPDDLFAISLTGPEQLTVDLKGNRETAMSFYLKGETTNIGPNPDFDLAYLTAGEYTVSELVPMNYEQVAIWLDTNPLGVDDNWVKLDPNATVKIDKDNPSLNLKVTNTQVNDQYWQDKVNVANTFSGYVPPTPPDPTLIEAIFERWFGWLEEDEAA